MKEIKLTQGKVALVDDEDFDYLNQWRWCAHKCHKSFYAVRNGNKTESERGTIQMHSVIMQINGKCQLDHENRDGLDNRKSNLRRCNHSQNNANRVKHKGRSKYKGIHFIKGGYIESRICVDKKMIRLGMCKTEYDAAVLYDIAAKKYFGEFANLNFK